MSSTPEWSTIGSGRMQALHAIASISIKENAQAANAPAPRQPMDLVCVLDNSGSMSGGKFTHLKHAIRFVQSQLTADDRLSLVVFNSYAKGVHGLYRMNDAQKAVSESMVNSLQVTGCTDIHAGMKMGHEILANRTTKNPISCMFLLTDGQDGGKLAEKKALAASMKTAGTGLFVFAFGADHDSAHLNAISSAAESSFVYVESTDEVVDAFGGALGSQQGLAAKNMRLTVSGVADGVLIDEVNAGDYPVTVAAGRRGATVTFSSLFVGERRDVIVRMIVPAIDTESGKGSLVDHIKTGSAAPMAAAAGGSGAVSVDQYPLLELTASYETVGERSVVMHSTAEENARCVVARLAEAENPDATPAQRHVEVDAQIRRLAVTDLLKRALDMGDRNSIDEARKLLTDALADLTANSVAFKADHKVTEQLMTDLETAIGSMRTREHYASQGGRSRTVEAYSSNVQQRCAYSKGATKSPYQCSSSSTMQSRGKSSKC
jgi:Mg-chelatase subunit ChlD